MITWDRFADLECCYCEVSEIDLPDGEALLCARFIGEADSTRYLNALTAGGEIQWRQETIRLYGREHKLPRLTAWYGDPGCTYTYSGIRVEPMPWTPTLRAIKQRVEARSGRVFNSVLLNRYRDGNDGVSWHSDDEPELGPAPVIASLSFGQARRFQLRHKDKTRDLQREIILRDGSLLLMKGATQRNWLHQVPRSRSKRQPLGERVNLTFRVIGPAQSTG